MLSLLTGTDDGRLPRITSVMASPAGYEVRYEMGSQLAPLVSSINTRYSSTSGGPSLIGTTLASGNGTVVPAVGSVTASMLLPVGEMVSFQLETEIGLHTYSSQAYVLDTLMVQDVCLYMFV